MVVVVVLLVCTKVRTCALDISGDVFHNERRVEQSDPSINSSVFLS